MSGFFVPKGATMIALVKIDYDGIRIYNIDGKLVKVWPGYLFCRECGRPLTDPHSQRIGYGPGCASRRNSYRNLVILAIGGEVPEKIREDSYHPVIKLVAPTHAPQEQQP
jgi:hypothetical protein